MISFFPFGIALAFGGLVAFVGFVAMVRAIGDTKTEGERWMMIIGSIVVLLIAVGLLWLGARWHAFIWLLP